MDENGDDKLSDSSLIRDTMEGEDGRDG